ncbi:hypothetical protein JTE90_022788 [Oedothorax gibbosus]|uniref:Uncharacterized protein n=1 Tax=Oedothorax gibbosus TaxID=931172 RepID=A0AAV6U7Y6_9ARAC|nr:hypothetical protein JTE90_022788 [Oedothorax gibbosus]
MHARQITKKWAIFFRGNICVSALSESVLLLKGGGIFRVRQGYKSSRKRFESSTVRRNGQRKRIRMLHDEYGRGGILSAARHFGR